MTCVRQSASPCLWETFTFLRSPEEKADRSAMFRIICQKRRTAVGKIEAICISEKKGTVKRPVEEALLVEEFGIRGDAHAGKWHRQVSILGYEKIKEFNEQGGKPYRIRNRCGQPCCGRPSPGRRCGPGSNPEGKGVSQPLRYLQKGRKMHYAHGGHLSESGPRRDPPGK